MEAKRLHFRVAGESGVPVYRQLMDQVKYYLASGVLARGDQLPSIRELAQAMAVNPATVVKAYSELEHLGVVEMRRGRGAFITESGPRLSGEECERALRGLVRQLVVEGYQVGVDAGVLVKMVREEYARMGDGELEGYCGGDSVRVVSRAG